MWEFLTKRVGSGGVLLRGRRYMEVHGGRGGKEGQRCRGARLCVLIKCYEVL